MAWLPKKRVVVPIDFSGVSVDAISTALELVDEPSAVHVIHVVMPIGNIAIGVDWGTIDDASREQSVRDHFDEFLHEHGYSNVTTVIRNGDPGTKISDYANECDADLIVIPSHGYHGVKRMLLGSVTERVLRVAGVEILVLRRSDAE